MKKILFLFLVVLVFVGCDERFMSWKEYNEEWLVAQRDKLGTDTNVVDTQILPSGVLIEKYHTGYGAIQGMAQYQNHRLILLHRCRVV